MKINLFWTSFLLISLFGCREKEQISTTKPYIYEQSLLGCYDYTIINPELDFQINHVYDYQDFLIYGGFDDLVISNVQTNEIITHEPIGVIKLVEFESNLMVCAKQGIFQITPAGEVQQKTPEVYCDDMILTSQGNLLFTARGIINDTLDTRKIYEWSESEGISAFSDAHLAPMHGNLGKLTEANNGDIWGISGKPYILRFREGHFLDYFDEANAPINVADAYMEGTFLATYGNGMIAVLKNGINFYQVLKFQNDEWITLFDIRGSDDLSDHEIEMISPSLQKILIRDDRLYIATSQAGCRGFHVFNLNKNELLQPEDYYVIRDPEFDNQCFRNIHENDLGEIFIINHKNNIIMRIKG